MNKLSSFEYIGGVDVIKLVYQATTIICLLHSQELACLFLAMLVPWL